MNFSVSSCMCLLNSYSICMNWLLEVNCYSLCYWHMKLASSNRCELSIAKMIINEVTFVPWFHLCICNLFIATCF
jgi:hypothetical protein